MPRLFKHPWNRAALLLLAALPMLQPGSARAASLYRAGDVVEDFTLTDRDTGLPARLADFAGTIVVLDWFAWWCPFCQAAAPEMRAGIKDYYASRGGNPDGVPVRHVGINLQGGQEAQTSNFVTRAGFERVLQDFSRTAANRFASGGQPIFAIINGVTNSTSHRPWELLYSRLGYGQNQFPIGEFRAAIDAVRAGPPSPALPARLSSPLIRPDGTLRFQMLGEAGRVYRIESSSDLNRWDLAFEVTGTGEVQTLEVPGRTGSGAVFVRAASP